ncbi:hypothetical protein HBF32_08100 [Luteibacter yeojuensis]|uniref:Lipoprotein n=1 Tax=Luteibacter yeojuensis TaxID=345309 RepID=A0A7X5TQ37_9GAMM|nr:hypothetical protein [Luteibacter yeojuensis]
MLAVFLVLAALSACSSSSDARKALEAQGFTDIQTHGHAFFGCSDSDDFATKFEATSPTGQHVTGVVCSGWLKGATVRF